MTTLKIDNPTPQAAIFERPTTLFTAGELGRVGVAVTMLVALGTAIIIVQAAMMGYNSLAQAAPKAILDGAVIAMLIGRTRRWRTLALLGPVYGLVLLLQTGIVYLPFIMTLAAVAGAGIGALFSRWHRLAGLMLAAVLYELLAGAGRPLHIYFATGGGDEPLLWIFYFIEWPLRIGGALLGVWIGWRFRAAPAERSIARSSSRAAMPSGRPKVRTQARNRISPAIKLSIAMVGCMLPMFIEPWHWLGLLAGGYLMFAVVCGLRRGVLAVVLGLVWLWLMYALASYLWHQDIDRVVDLLRTVVLRFMPLMFSAAVVAATIRRVELVRLLRRWRLSPAIVLPLSSTLRAVPVARRQFIADWALLRSSEDWRGPFTPVLRPLWVMRGLIEPQFRHWAGLLAEPGNTNRYTAPSTTFQE